MAERLIRKSELARHLGVHPAAITKACRGVLKPAVRGGWILVEHPATRYYVTNPGVVSRRKTAQANQRYRKTLRAQSGRASPALRASELHEPAPRPPQPELITAAELARRAGVWPQAISRALRAGLAPAVVDRKLIATHPLVLAYIHRHRHRKRGTMGRPRNVEDPPRPHNPLLNPTLPSDALAPGARPAVPAGPELSAVDPLALAARFARGKAVDIAQARGQYRDSFLNNLQSQTAGALPESIEDLGAMTLREVIDRAGSFEALQTAVKSLKLHCEYRKTDIEAKRRRGTLVDRAAVERTIFPYVDLTQKRIVEEMPKAVAERIVARVLTGGDDLALDVEALIRNECASVYRDCKAATVAALAAFDGD